MTGLNQMSWLNAKVAIVFVVIFAHNTLLDLFLVNGQGEPIFLWEKNLTWTVVLTHLFIASLVTIIYALSMKSRYRVSPYSLRVSDRVWGMCSLFLFLTIIFVLW